MSYSMPYRCRGARSEHTWSSTSATGSFPGSTSGTGVALLAAEMLLKEDVHRLVDVEVAQVLPVDCGSWFTSVTNCARSAVASASLSARTVRCTRRVAPSA